MQFKMQVWINICAIQLFLLASLSFQQQHHSKDFEDIFFEEAATVERLFNRHKAKHKNLILLDDTRISDGACNESIETKFVELDGELAERVYPLERTTRLGRICLWNCPPIPDTTTLHLFVKPKTGEQPQAKINKSTTSDQLRSSGFDPKKEIIILIHGFQGRGIRSQSWARRMKELILSKNRLNLFFVDWSHYSAVYLWEYVKSRDAMPVVAQDIYKILLNLKATFPSIDITSAHVFGHSLGAHIAGLIGQLMNGKLKRITALGKMIRIAPINDRSFCDLLNN